MASFVKILTDVDAKKQVAIPSYFVKHLPYHEGGSMITFPVHDVSGNVWENFGYYARRKGSDYAKPVFQKGWRNYVRAKRLTRGDKIIFRVEPKGSDGAPKYRIGAQKKIVLFGATIGWKPEF